MTCVSSAFMVYFPKGDYRPQNNRTGDVFLMSEKQKRFEVSYSQGLNFSVLVDRQTGVNYLMVSTGITPLLDAEGKPVVTLVENK